jgi:hypothetical protein
MTEEVTCNGEFEESDFPELSIDDELHLRRQEKSHGRHRVVGWLKAKVAIPLKYQFEEDFDEDAYFEAMAEYYVSGE